MTPLFHAVMHFLMVAFFFVGLSTLLTILGLLMMPSLTRRTPEPPNGLTHTTEASDDQ